MPCGLWPKWSPAVLALSPQLLPSANTGVIHNLPNCCQTQISFIHNLSNCCQHRCHSQTSQLLPNTVIHSQSLQLIPTLVLYTISPTAANTGRVQWPKSTKNAVGPPSHSCAVVQLATGYFEPFFRSCSPMSQCQNVRDSLYIG